jgi:nucleotide-binding universal stress UspA family protein
MIGQLHGTDTPTDSSPVPEEHGYKRILIALDGTPPAEQVLPYIRPIARMFGATMSLVCVAPSFESDFMRLSPGMAAPGAGYGVEQILQTEEEIKELDARYLDRMKGQLESEGFPVECYEPEGTPADAIVQCAKAHNIDLVAMVTHGRSGIPRVILGGIADSVVRHAPCPVLLVHLKQTD